MKRIMATGAQICAVALLAACGGESDTPDASTRNASPPVAETLSAERPAAPMASGPAPAVDAPDFAALYPGAALDAPAVTASGPAGPGGLVTYTTEADPDAVIAFYRQRAEAAGLSSVMAMNQGEVRAYGAAKGDVGANLQVVASPTDDGQTSVQLSWTAGG